MKKIIMCVVMVALCLTLFACGKSEAVKAVEDAIDAIGEVTVDSGDLIKVAEDLFENLTEEEKANSGLKEEIEEIKKEYADAKDQKTAKDLIAKIDAIGAVTLNSGAAIAEAETLYNSLSDEGKALITNYSKLQSAASTLKNLRAQEKSKVLAAKTPLFSISEDRVEGIKWYTPKAMPTYIDTRSYIVPYIGERSNGQKWICIRYNYTGDDWIFWENLTIMVDGKKYFKSVSRSDLIRDNEAGNVWEYYDEILDVNVPVSNSDIQMLYEIAKSKETIIRFEGDEYYEDLTVSGTDKQTIANVLSMYEALLW